jgi:Putative antitoxin
MHDPCMATKTISLELDAYEKLRKAKRSERESFSEVVRRARFDDGGSTGPKILERLSELRRGHPDSFLPDDALDRIDDRARTVRSVAVTDADA